MIYQFFHENCPFFEGFEIPKFGQFFVSDFWNTHNCPIILFWFFLKYLEPTILWKIKELHNIGLDL